MQQFRIRLYPFGQKKKNINVRLFQIAHLKGKSIMNTMSIENKAVTFAAVKLIEELYKRGKISAEVFENILDENSNIIDTSKFCCCQKDKPLVKVC